MRKNRRNRSVKPDDSFSSGPLTVARSGPNMFWRVDWPEDAFREFQENQHALYPKVVQEIDTLVFEIADIVAKLPPERLLHQAWRELADRHSKIESESDLDIADAVSMRMLDYVQSIIAAVSPSPDQASEITEDDWLQLSEKVGALFEKISHSYQVCRTAKNRATDPHFDLTLEEFHFRAQIHWCNVRGKRYQVHEPAYLRLMFLPHSDVLMELFGISGEKFVDEVIKIWHALSFGLGDALEEMDTFRRDTLDVLKEKIASKANPIEKDFRVMMADVINEKGWEGRRDTAFGRLLGTDLFDVQKTTALPEKLLAELAWSPGEDAEFFAAGEYRGWPLRIWPIFKRPFIRLNGRYYCFDLYSLLDHIYRVMQRVILDLKPDYRETWNSIQRDLSENLPFEYFAHLLPGAKILRPVYYRGQTSAGTRDWCEADGILIYDDHLFVIEARGGAFTYTPPASDFPAWIASLNNLVLKPATQGGRFVEYLKSADVVPLFDSHRVQMAELRHSEFRHVTVCPVTLDPITEMAAQLQHFRKIGVDVGADPIWAMSVDDLQVYVDIFENPLLFLHYAEQRIRAFQSDVIQSDDELDHLGLYLKHNDYSTYAATVQRESKAEVQFIGYRSGVDRFFAQRMRDPDIPCPLMQEIPARVLEVIQLLAESPKPGRSGIASYLLDLGEHWRQTVASNIDEELERQAISKSAQIFSTHGNVDLTIACWGTAWVRRDTTLALEHARIVLLVNEDRRRLLLNLTFTGEAVLSDVDWQWVEMTSIPDEELPKLRAEAERLRRTRVAQARAKKRKIGRNEQCPCGSGKKYKKCCLGR